jgi:hypothetical protein
MMTMAGSMSTIASTLADAMRKATSTMRPLNHAVFTGPVANANVNTGIPVAIALIEANEGFSDDNLVNAEGCLMAHLNLAMTYASLTSQSTHSRSIQKQMENFQA